jgi:protein dithiol oxidoreductase (disulfide-forming)
MFRHLLAILFLSGCVAVSAQAATLGKDYIELKPARATATKDKVEVLEFFWYGCPHCGQFEPDLAQWGKKQSSRVALTRQPAVLGESWMTLTQAYYALEALGEVNRLHGALFNAIHGEGRKLSTADDFYAWAAGQGVNKDKLKASYQSFAVSTKASHAKQLSRDYALDGVPALVINGKYLTSPGMVGSYEGALRVADELIAKEIKAMRR